MSAYVTQRVFLHLMCILFSISLFCDSDQAKLQVTDS